jgi:hypothetical protein
VSFVLLKTRTRLAAFGTSGGRNAVASATLNKAAFAPIPNASVATAANVNNGAFASERAV